ncbi:UNVERIFIED_CONTAM: hypothetical protein PYX00_002842 [Menopon gallinae]|uniref:G-protein coupled receptors family 1 profile domain-containing protein n=1 Tax=Menopon gallinae TaxID=328185 RepID=A0AAW2HY61_9NEOP
MNGGSDGDILEQNDTDYVYNDSVFASEVNAEPLNRHPLYIVLPITVIYGTIFLTGIIGNISTCVVIARNKHMHTATNYYLFSLAISDLLLLLSGLPPEMYDMWRKHSYVFGETFCILQSFAAETSANATVLTITAFTVERYVAICHPFQSHTLSKLSRAVKFVVAIWLLALCLAIPQAIQYGIVVHEPSSSSSIPATYCTIKKILIQNAFVISTCVFFVTPMTVITVLYILIGVKLRRSRLISVKRPSVNERNMDVSRHRGSSSQSHVIKMLGESFHISSELKFTSNANGETYMNRE